MRVSGTRAYYRPSPPKMPPGLVELMEGLTKEVLKQSPTDVYGFCASHMQQLLEKRDGPSPKKSLSLEEKVAKAQEKVRKRAKIRRDEYDKALLQQQQRNSNAADNDVKQGSTLQVPQLITVKVPQSVSTDIDKDTIKQNIQNKPIHHEHALESSAEMEISHELGSDIGKPISTYIATESTEEKVTKKQNDLEESKIDTKIVNVENSYKNENKTAAESSNESDKTLLNVSSNVNPETENKQISEEPLVKSASYITSDSNTVIDQLKEYADQQIKPVDVKDSAKAENTTGVEKAKDIIKITPENSAIENTVEMTKSLNDVDVNVINSNISDGFQIKTVAKPEDIQVSNITDVIHTGENIKTSSVTGVQQSSTTLNPQTVSTNDKLNTGPCEDTKLPNSITGKPQESDNSDNQRGNNPNTVQEVNSDKGNTRIKNDEKVQPLNNTVSTEKTSLKIEEAQVSKNESNELSNTATGIVQESENSEIQRGNNPNTVQEVNSDKGNLPIKGDEQVQQLNNMPSLKIEEAQLSKNESNKLSNAATGIVQESDISEIERGNNPNTVHGLDSDKGNAPIKGYEQVQQLKNMPFTEVSSLKVEEAQLSKNESNKLTNPATGIVQESDNCDIQPGNNPNIVHEVNSNKGNTPIKGDEQVQQLNNMPSTEVLSLKIEEAQLFKNESNKPLNAATGIVQESDYSDTQHGNNPYMIQRDNSNKGTTVIKTDQKVPQIDLQLPQNSESNKPKDVETLDNIEKFTKPTEETKKTVVSKLESRIDVPVTGVDRDIPTMVTENLANNDDNGLKSVTLDTKIKQHDDKDNADSGKVASDLHMHHIAKANSSDSNADVSIPLHSTEDDDISHDEGSANLSDKAQNYNQDGSTMDLETAAITIQKVFRNFLFKSRGSTFEDTANDEGNFLDEDDKNKEECEFPIASALNIDRRAHGITRMDTVLQTVNEEKSLSLSTDDSSTLSSAATIIQAHVRGFLVRNKLNSNKTISTNSLAASNSNEPSITSLEADNDHNKNKTILNIHIVPEGENYFSRDESLINSMDLSLDSSPPSSINLHPLGYDKSERRKQLKREDAIQSISPPSNNSGKLSEDLDSVKELSLNERDIVGEQLNDHDNNIIKEELAKENRIISPIQNGSLETDVKTNGKNITNNTDDSETLLKQKRKSLTKMSSDEMDVVTPFVSNEDTASSILIHSGEFHDAVLPTRVSRSDTSVVSGE